MGFIAGVRLVRVVGLRVGAAVYIDGELCAIIIVPVVGGTLVAGGHGGVGSAAGFVAGVLLPWKGWAEDGGVLLVGLIGCEVTRL